jgi:hypothetical protein
MRGDRIVAVHTAAISRRLVGDVHAIRREQRTECRIPLNGGKGILLREGGVPTRRSRHGDKNQGAAPPKSHTERSMNGTPS